MRVLVNHLNNLVYDSSSRIKIGFTEPIEVGEVFVVIDFFEPESVAALTRLHELAEQGAGIDLLQDAAKSIPTPSVHYYRCLKHTERADGGWIIQGDRLPRATLDKTL